MKKITTIAFMLLVVTSCSNNGSNRTPKNCTISTASIVGAYKVTGATYKATPTSAEVDCFLIIFPDACRRDDLYTFKTNGAYSISDVGIVCSPNSSEDGTWTLVGNNMQIDGEPSTIEKFDCKTLELATTDFNNPGDKLKIIMTRQ